MPITEADPAQPSMSDTDVDALLTQIESPAQETRPMHDQPAAPQAPPAANQTQVAQEIKFNWNGREIKAPLDKATLWASQGYDYAQKMSEFNQTKTQFELQQKAIQETEARYKPIDEYVRQNPEWWNHITQAYENRARDGNADPVLSKVQELLQSKLQPIEQFVQSQLSKEQAQQRETEDSRLKADTESIRKQYPDLDFDTRDDTGKSLEYKVLEYASQNDIKNFKTAFRDFYHDNLVHLAEERGKSQVVKDTQKRTKLGLLGTTQAPVKSLSEAKDLKAKTYDDLLSEAKQELGIA